MDESSQLVASAPSNSDEKYNTVQLRDDEATAGGYKSHDAEHEKPQKEPIRNLIAFFICGLLNNYSYVVMLSSAEHMVCGG